MPAAPPTDTSMLERLVAPAGKDVVDIGCGGGALVRDLAAAGARPIGIEISEEQLAAAQARDDGSGARYLVGRAEALPLDDGSVDVVVFMRSLHHVPHEHLEAGLREARRVLRPGGAVYVAEPLAEGDFFALTSLVEDELEVRRAAQAALAGAGRVGLERAVTDRLRRDRVPGRRRGVPRAHGERRPRAWAACSTRAATRSPRPSSGWAAPGERARRALLRGADARRRAAPGQRRLRIRPRRGGSGSPTIGGAGHLAGRRVAPLPLEAGLDHGERHLAAHPGPRRCRGGRSRGARRSPPGPRPTDSSKKRAARCWPCQRNMLL